MAGFLIPLAGMALGALGRLVDRRRQQRALQGAQGSAHGKAINMQPTGPPTNAVSQAATSSPTPPTAPSAPTAVPGRGPRQTAGELGAEQQRHEAEKAARHARTSSPLEPGSTNSDGGLAAQMGQESAARSRKRNREQQAALGAAAIK